MKKLSPYLAFLSVFFLPYTQAQVLTVHNPNSKVTVTNEQVVSWGQTVKDTEPGPIHLNFEGLGNLDEVGQFYNGGKSKSGFSGQNYGVTFSGNALAIIDSQHGGSGNFSSDIMPNTVLFFLTGSEIYLNVVSGFTGEISFYYSSVTSGTVSVYDGPNATGTMLTTMGFQPLSLGFKSDSAG